jgi:hypothetical protein
MNPTWTVDETSVEGMTYHWDSNPEDIVKDIDLATLEAIRASMDEINNAPPAKLGDIRKLFRATNTSTTASIINYLTTALALIGAGFAVYSFIRCFWTAPPKTTTTQPTAPPYSINMENFLK